MNTKRFVVAGAGSIGFFVGGLLASSGRRVTFLGRPRLNDQVAASGLRLTDFSGLDVSIESDALALSTNPEALMAADLILVCVKSGATEEMAKLIATYASPAAAVVSLQNGLAGARELRRQLPGRDVRSGMVVFNVVPRAEGHFHKATSGNILISAGAENLAQDLSVPGLEVQESHDMEAVQWGKLVLNLTNALNGLSGLPLQAFLLRRDWRLLMADQLSEALRVLRAAGQPLERATPMPTALFPWMLRLPTPLFRRVAARMLTIDPAARTSMSYDLDAGRTTEIDALQGEVIALGKAQGIATPLNAAVAKMVKSMEGKPMQDQATRPTPKDILASL